MRVEDARFASASGCALSGSIVASDADAPAPGLVLVGGSGPADRHNGGYFDALVDDLAASGLVVLVYDKRGTG